jgi:aminoglycoside phosphotransferase (APT) family kinase protein
MATRRQLTFQDGFPTVSNGRSLGIGSLRTFAQWLTILTFARAKAVIGRYEKEVVSMLPTDRVLVHGDFGFHNIALEHPTLALRGVFDWEAACWADQHLDFRYLVADLQRWNLFEAVRAGLSGAPRPSRQARRESQHVRARRRGPAGREIF